jgi:hypothetical protein
MSSNLTAAWPHGIFCVSDRRLVDLISGKIRTNRSTKMTVFGCSDAYGVITYNGIGSDENGDTPNQWLLKLHEKEKIFDYSLPEILASIRIDLDQRLESIRLEYGAKKAKHTFVISAWHHGVSTIYGISNYERVDRTEELKEASERATTSSFWPSGDAKLRLISTGAHIRHADGQAIMKAIKSGPPNRMRVLCVKALKNLSFGKGKGRGTVGATCQWAFLGPKRDDIWCGMDVVGGTNAQETPNLINIAANLRLGGTQSVRFGGPGMIIADSYAGDRRASQVGNYDQSIGRFVFKEPLCGICGNPLPASHQLCEVCLYEVKRRDSDSSAKS